MQAAAPGAVLVAEKAIGVEVVGDALTQFDHDAGIDGAGVIDQRALSRRYVGGRNAGRQHIHRPAYRLDVVVTDGAGRHRGGQLGQLRCHRRPGQRPARSDPDGQFEPAGDLLRSDAQPLPQRRSRHREGPYFVRWVGDLAEEPVHQPAVGALLGLQPLSHIDAERVAHQTRRRLPHYVVGSINRIQSSQDLFPCLLGADC